MTSIVDNHPIFDELAAQYEDEFGQPLFTLVIEEGDGYNTLPPIGTLPIYVDFMSSFPNEWILYHSPNGESAAQRIHAWTGQPPEVDIAVGVAHEVYEEDSEPDRRSIAAAMAALAKGREDNKPLDEVMDVIFGPKQTTPEVGTIKTFIELDEADQKLFIERALADFKDLHNMRADEITPAMLVDQATVLYEDSPIKILHTPPLSEEQVAARIRLGDDAGTEIFYADGTVEDHVQKKLAQKAEEFKKHMDEQPSIVDLSAVITEGVEAGLIEVEHDPSYFGAIQDQDTDFEAAILTDPEPDEEGVAPFTDPDDDEQKKVNTFWNQQT